MHHKAFVAGGGFALGAGQRVFLAGCGVQEHGEVFAHRCEAFGHHLFGCAAHHHPIAVCTMDAQQGIAHRTTDQK